MSWLYEYCDPGLDATALEERLTMTGTKVETILHHGVPSVERFVVGRVLDAQPHPDADRLKVCKVDVGEGEIADIVCGAPNVAAGQTVAVALPGAVMPGGSEIEAAKLRGVASAGMILAADELQIDSDHSGIMVLDELLEGGAELAPGTPLADVLPICTDVVELEITPNRPDCLGVYGVARELHAATGAALAAAPWSEGPEEAHETAAAPASAGGAAESPTGGESAAEAAPRAGTLEAPNGGTLVRISVECPDLCPRFTARAFENVTIAPSPPWLKARLSAAGQRPINNVVDITNYAMLLTSQPLHAFDLDRIAGGQLTVRRARAGEPVTTLDGQERQLDSEMVVIEDADGPTSIAGLMGGERSEVQDDTTRVLMEVANWSGPNIHRSSWTLGLRSEASSRFEKGLAPEQCMDAQAVATKLMVELCKATPVPGTIDLVFAPVPAQRIRLRERRVQEILGMPVSRSRQAEILRALDFEVADASDGLDVTVPPARRTDVTREADLIEEVARIHGLAELPTTLPARRGAYGRLSPQQRLRRRAVDALCGRGLNEAVGWTFTAPTLHDRLRLAEDDPRRHAVALENPLSEDQSLLRTTLLGSLLDAAAHNTARGMPDLRLFETGTVFVRDEQAETGVREHQSLAVLLSGALAPATWSAPDPPKADLFAVKGVLEALGAALRVQVDCRASGGGGERSGGGERGGGEPFLHPGRAAEVVCEGQALGWLGELHPLVAREWGIDGAGVMELRLDRLLDLAVAERSYRDVISYPALSQDIAVVLPEQVAAAQVLDLVRAAGTELLDEVSVFDVYSGAQVGEGKRSLALALHFRAPDRTLTDGDVVPLRERIVAALGELGGELRG